MNYAMNGSTLCATHGKNPVIRNAAQRRHAADMAKRRAIKKIEREGIPGVRGAEAVIDILEERLAVQVAMVRALDDIVRRLTDMDQLRYENRAGEQLRGEVQAWLAVNQMITRLGSDYLKIGLDERKTRLAEAQARVLMGVITAIMGRLELTSSQRKIAAAVIPEELERVSLEKGDN